MVTQVCSDIQKNEDENNIFLVCLYGGMSLVCLALIMHKNGERIISIYYRSCTNHRQCLHSPADRHLAKNFFTVPWRRRRCWQRMHIILHSFLFISPCLLPFRVFAKQEHSQLKSRALIYPHSQNKKVVGHSIWNSLYW